MEFSISGEKFFTLIGLVALYCVSMQRTLLKYRLDQQLVHYYWSTLIKCYPLVTLKTRHGTRIILKVQRNS